MVIGGSKGGGVPGTHAPRGSKFFHFHAVFSKNLKNNSNFGSWRTPLGKILDPPLMVNIFMLRLFTSSCSHSYGESERDIASLKVRDHMGNVQNAIFLPNISWWLLSKLFWFTIADLGCLLRKLLLNEPIFSRFQGQLIKCRIDAICKKSGIRQCVH